ncbi:MAG: sodium/proline symporter [Candidatus Marinimicrobia bacterium]|jgi:sodium/proline symporter|nr:sodium/proline symporter [Candidatus Neomarinimicrobiota bacterium]MBT3500901.1 sodium/proline symporter [Candidatus Neomarinimicrobiota bacterium]MBT3840104.1 sodium/proline symporter [Candidatus Neomarinimicrobiota bacterium]MBT3999573.1 sodium/proline symporter [Candidatus Neomarinimicrobiota bacterium]MBT4282977.1 sodium/proline symporter [Candidatus Neomarinimicrobiota bacterium]
MDIIGIIFILYLTLLLGVGIWTFKFNKTQEDYFLAGRNLGPWVTAFSERASGESAWLLLALPGAAITIGLGESWTVLGTIFGIIASWFLIAEKLREETEKYDALTIPEYLHRRFNDTSNIIRLFSAIIIAFFFMFYVSAQFHASGKVLNSLFDLNPIIGISIGAAIIIIYTLMGGFYAVAWTDLLQGILMIGTLVILPIAGYLELSDSGKTISDGLASAKDIFNNNNDSFFMGKSGIAALASVLGGLSWGLGYLGQPHLVIRYMAIRSPKDVKVARRIAIAWAIPGITGAFFVGIVALLYFGPEYFLTVDPEQAMPLLASKLLHPVLAGLFISGAVAAMMSTADSQLLVSTSAVTEDFYHQYLGKELSDQQIVKLSRIMIVVLGLAAFAIAIFSEIQGNKIFGVVSYAWSGLGSAFGPALVLTLWWKKTTRKGIISGLVVGFLTTIIWASVPELKAIVTERLSSFLLSFIAVYIVSLNTQNDN